MDKLFSAGKEFLEEQMQQGGGNNSSSNYNNDYSHNNSHSNSYSNNPLPGGNKAYGGNYPAGGGGGGGFHHHDEDFRLAHEEASHRAGSSGSSELFSNIISSISEKKGRLAEGDFDEQDAIRKHKNTYQDDAGNADANSLGTAAALQALKKFVQGETGGKQSQGAFLGLAMSEASKLFDSKLSQGKLASGASKESTVQQAGELAMKMYLKSQGGGQQQGGVGGLMSLASKFL